MCRRTCDTISTPIGQETPVSRHIHCNPAQQVHDLGQAAKGVHLVGIGIRSSPAKPAVGKCLSVLDDCLEDYIIRVLAPR